LGEIANEVKGKFSVLIIAPTKIQCRLIADGLKKKGFSSIEWKERKSDKDQSLLDGIRILLDDINSNLGWRIASQFYLDDEVFNEALESSCTENPKRFIDLISSEKKKEIKSALRVVRAVRDGKKTEEAKLYEVLLKLGYNPIDMVKENLREEIEATGLRIGNPGLRKTQIKITTIESSKGLAADYVFIPYFDDIYFIKSKKNISNKDVCKFLVALTRARRRAYLISSSNSDTPTFLSWINEDRIQILD
ncbi:MAG: 3'-5' exonuclease, partial [Bacteroidota bacterium]